MSSPGISKNSSTERIAVGSGTPAFRLPRAETVLGVGVSVVVAALVLPPLCAVVLTGAGFAPLREPGVVLNTLMFGVLTTICALLLGGR